MYKPPMFIIIETSPHFHNFQGLYIYKLIGVFSASFWLLRSVFQAPFQHTIRRLTTKKPPDQHCADAGGFLIQLLTKERPSSLPRLQPAYIFEST
jgi:hypothetical protein